MPSTAVSISGESFLINGTPTHAGRSFRGRSIEGRLFISRMANAIVNDRNLGTIGAWEYADGPWSAERNTREFLAALPAYRRCGLDAVAVNLQGGSPQGYSWHQPWRLSGFAPDGAPYPDYLERLAQVIRAADAQGMVVNLGLFYGAAARSLTGEAAVVQAVSATCDWVVAGGFGNVLLEIGNEIDIPAFNHDIIKPGRCAELIALAKMRAPGTAVSTSFKGGVVPPEDILAASDYVLLHGNRVDHPDGVRAQVAGTRASAAYRGQPIFYNEDDHYDFDQPDNNFVAAIEGGAGWGFFDYRRIREPFADGYQSLPVDWDIGSERKRGFFRLLAEITGGEAPA